MQTSNSKYFAILNCEETLFVEITQERLDTILYEYEGDDAMYMAMVLSEEFGFNINDVQWSIISPNQIKCIGTPITIEVPEPTPQFIVQRHIHDRYEGGVGTDDVYGPYLSREDALDMILSYTYEDEYRQVCHLDVDEKQGRGTGYDGWYDHILQIKKL